MRPASRDLLVAAGEQEDIRQFFAQAHARSGTLSKKEDGRCFRPGMPLRSTSKGLAATSQ